MRFNGSSSGPSASYSFLQKSKWPFFIDPIPRGRVAWGYIKSVLSDDFVVFPEADGQNFTIRTLGNPKIYSNETNKSHEAYSNTPTHAIFIF